MECCYIFHYQWQQKMEIFSHHPKIVVFKKFFHSPPQSSCQIHLNHTGVCLWCFASPQGEHCVFLWGLPCVVDSHKHVTCLCAHEWKPLWWKGFSCVVSTVHGVLVGAPYDNMIVVIGLSTTNLCVCGGVWSLSVQHSTLVGSVFPW